MNSVPKVSVCMITYGHEKYIREAIEGVLMQECKFEVELIVANDCSPDSTDAVVKDIIKNHPRGNWIRYFNQEENLGIGDNFKFALQECTGEYISICEGDDFWINPKKLQIQVDFLDQNQDYIIHSGNAIFKSSNPKTNEKTVFNLTKNSVFKLEDFLVNNNLITCTSTFRNLKISFPENFKQVTFKDWYLYVLLLQASSKDAYRINEVYSTYRIHEGGVMKSLSDKRYFEEHIFQIKTIKAQIKYRQLPFVAKAVADSYFLSLYKIKLKEKLYREALEIAVANLKFTGRDFSLLKHFKITAKNLIIKD